MLLCSLAAPWLVGVDEVTADVCDNLGWHPAGFHNATHSAVGRQPLSAELPVIATDLRALSVG
ncbi:hypothetical protein QP460_004965 [Corynebacterium amycolatum]|uniref:Uncharacterized protein n=2 Tax=Bacillati TaxID=1783272 RepID=A0AAW9ST89_CORAY